MEKTDKTLWQRLERFNYHTNPAIAEVLGCDTSTISRWKTGATTIPAWAYKSVEHLERAEIYRLHMERSDEQVKQIKNALSAFKSLMQSVPASHDLG